MVQDIGGGCNSKEHEEEDEQGCLPVVGADMLRGIQNGPHEPPCIIIHWSGTVFSAPTCHSPFIMCMGALLD